MIAQRKQVTYTTEKQLTNRSKIERNTTRNKNKIAARIGDEEIVKYKVPRRTHPL